MRFVNFYSCESRFSVIKMHNFPQAYSLKDVNFKGYGISSFAHPHSIPNKQDFISSVKHRDTLQNLPSQKIDIPSSKDVLRL